MIAIFVADGKTQCALRHRRAQTRARPKSMFRVEVSALAQDLRRFLLLIYLSPPRNFISPVLNSAAFSN